VHHTGGREGTTLEDWGTGGLGDWRTGELEDWRTGGRRQRESDGVVVGFDVLAIYMQMLNPEMDGHHR
jgi:hypothetical protein